MSLHKLEGVLDEVAGGFARFADGCLYTSCESPMLEGMRYSLVIEEAQQGYAEVYWLLPKTTVPIKNIKQFLRYVHTKNDDPALQFEDKESCFILTAYLQPETYAQDLQEFILECDRYAPLLFAVSMCGEWSKALVDMALQAPHSMAQA